MFNWNVSSLSESQGQSLTRHLSRPPFETKMAGHLEVRLNLNMDFLKIRDLTVSGSLPADNASSPSVTSGGAYMYRNSGDVKNACSNRFLVW